MFVIRDEQFGEDVKGNDRCVVKIKYPEFEQDSDAEDEDSEDSEGSSDGIKLPKLITKEAVIAILKPNVVGFSLYSISHSAARADESEHD